MNKEQEKYWDRGWDACINPLKEEIEDIIDKTDSNDVVKAFGKFKKWVEKDLAGKD